MKTLVTILSLFACTSLNAQKAKLFLSSWRENGNAELNITSDKYSYSEKSKLYYFLSNDNDNIYVDMKFEDPGVQNRILKEGLIVWISMDGKHAKKMGVRFPIGSQYSGGRNELNMTGVKLNADGSIVTPVSMANTIELIGFANEEKRRFPSDNADNFRASVKYDNEGTLHYKMLMPIAKLPVRNSKDSDGAMPFTFGIEYGIVPVMKGPGGPVVPPSSSEPPAGGSRGGSRGGGRSGGGMPGVSGQVRNSNSAQTVMPSILLWIKNIKLATDKLFL